MRISVAALSIAVGLAASAAQAQYIIATTQVSNDLSANYAEVALAASRFSPDVVVAWMLRPDFGGGGMRYAVSTNGVSFGQPQSLLTTSADPVAAFSRVDGTLWLGGLYPSTEDSLAVFLKHPGDLTVGPLIPAVTASAGATVDKPWLAVGPRWPSAPPGTEVMIAGFTRAFPSAADEVWTRASLTTGSSWSEPVYPVGSNLVSGDSGQGLSPAIIPSGLHAGRLVAAYHPFDGNVENTNSPVVLWSDHGGQPDGAQSSWHYAITTVNPPPLLLGQITRARYIGSGTQPVDIRGIAHADNPSDTKETNGPIVVVDPLNPQVVYVVFAGKPTGIESRNVDLIIAQSMDGGVTFDPQRTLIISDSNLIVPPGSLNHPAGGPLEASSVQFKVAAAVDDGGGVNLLFYSTVTQSPPASIEPLYARIPFADFSTLTTLSAVTLPLATAFVPTLFNTNYGRFIGDYNMLDVRGCTVYAGYCSEPSPGVRHIYVSRISRCPAVDVDSNSVVDATDATLFFNYFSAGDLRADMTRDGCLGMGDVTAFVEGYSCGCTPH